jgi:hypothetical protein
MGDIQRPEKVNNTWVKTMHVGMMDRGFTLLGIYMKMFHPNV